MAAALRLGLLLFLSPLRAAEPSTELPSSPEAPSKTRATAWKRGRRGPAPLTDVAKLCVCDLLVAQCDVNCCCDPDCSAEDFSLFTTCSVPIVTGDSRLCSQKAAIYSLDTEANPPERVFKLVDHINPSVFCIHATNYEQALSFSSPEIPTAENFDQLLKKYGGATFSAEPDSWSMNSDASDPSDANKSYRYEYGVPIQTVDAFLRLPSPVVSSWCSDANPAGFLVHQATKCIRPISVENCGNIQAVSMLFYINSSILAVPKSSQMVSYHITYTDTGEIIEAAASFVLGAVNKEALSVQQSFEISFTQVNTNPVPFSGNPGYVVGLAVRAGFKPQGYPFPIVILLSVLFLDQLHSDFLSWTPYIFHLFFTESKCVLFGYILEVTNVSILTAISWNRSARITAAMNCQPLAQVLLDLLMGQSFPEYVAPFGNSQAQDVLDWVPITHLRTSEQSSCQIPVALEIEVKWTKYGSLVNPQARIVNVTATTTTTTLKQLPLGRERTIPITSSVVFTDISSPAEPGYKAWPTINAKLPHDFFFPFV